MKADYYDTMKTKLQTISDIKHVGRWKNQIEGNKIAATPAVFIEIPLITYNGMSNKLQSADNVQVVLHLVMKKYTTEDTDDSVMYTLSQKIYNVLQNTDNIERLNESLDVTYENIEDFQLTYVITRLVDDEAQKTYTTEDRPTPNAINEMNDPDGS